jgi:hypothetical protein
MRVTKPARVSPGTASAWRRWERGLLLLYALTVVGIVIHQGLTHVDTNFAIFRASFRHLAAGEDLYAAYSGEQVDRFKYSPLFALLFAPFALLPTLIGLAAWNGLNVFLFVHAVRRLLPGAAAPLVLALVYLEVVRTTERAQSNALVAALIILAYLALEERRQVKAALAIVAGTLIKIFPVGALALAIFHERRWRLLVAVGLVTIAGLALPLLVTSPHALAGQFASWRGLESTDATASATSGGAGLYGGVMYQLRQWLGVSWPNWPVQLVGTLVLLAPLARVRCWRDPRFRLRFLCSLLVFVVIFNHQVESPSFVIAVTGIAIWFATSERTKLDVALMTLTILVVSVSSTELTPHWLQRDVFVRYRLKTVPCVLVWLVMQAELLGLRRSATSGKRAEGGEPDVAASQPLAHEG